jgi:hypothetical protein
MQSKLKLFAHCPLKKNERPRRAPRISVIRIRCNGIAFGEIGLG